MTVSSACISIRKESIVVIEEQKKSLRISNPNNLSIEVIRVDGCAIKNGVACDFAAFLHKNGALIEFKGTDTDHALEQLVATHEYFKVERPNCEKYWGYVVSAKVPSVTPSSLRKLEKVFNSTHMRVKMRSRVLSCSVETLFG